MLEDLEERTIHGEAPDGAEADGGEATSDWSLTRLVGQETPNLFEAAPSDVQRTLGGFATKKQFSGLAREFFARFTERYLKYFLSKELSNHVGPRRPFSNIHEHSSFLRALETHCRQASRIIEEFSAEWFSKTNFEGGVTPQKAADFVPVALKKIRAELRQGANGSG